MRQEIELKTEIDISHISDPDVIHDVVDSVVESWLDEETVPNTHFENIRLYTMSPVDPADHYIHLWVTADRVDREVAST